MPDDLNALRQIEGFPIGEDADILALSDPPYYTAYPNPHIGDFIAEWGKPYNEATDDYHREPYVTDVSEGKNDPIYNAHSYHTKVPYKAIIPFIEHYTEPGDIVFDGFCGTGMTGVAAQMVGRRAILCDLSPAATFIAHNYNTPVDAAAFEHEAKRILAEVEAECGWMYETRHTDGRIGRINYMVWSDVFICPYCGQAVVFWDVAADVEGGKVRNEFECPACRAVLTKRALTRATKEVMDPVLGRDVTLAQQVPVLINYSMGTRRFEKRPDDNDFDLLERIEARSIPHWFPVAELPQGYNTEQPRRSHGIGYIHQFYFKRNLWTLATIWARIPPNDLFWKHAVTGVMQGLSKLQRYRPKSTFPNMILSGTLYVGSLVREWNAGQWFEGKVRGLQRSIASRQTFSAQNVMIATQSVTDMQIPDASVDYIFTDPPFGGNLMYSELNFLWEAWLGVYTDNRPEAIMNDVQGKSLDEYRHLMTRSFSEMYRMLKPGRWITVVFHNSSASVWNAIQEGLARAGFLVAQVTILDKQQGTIKQITGPGAVKNDLVINAYKPRAGFTERFISTAGQGLEADFVRQHLRQLPLAANAERSKEMLYSKYLAYYVQHGYQVAYNGDQFYRTLGQWGLVERDGYWFADETQANEYEKRKTVAFGGTAKGARGPARDQAVLFISDERSARQWLWGYLAAPQSYSDIYTAYVKALQTSEDELPELRTMLEEGFIQLGGDWRRPDAVSQAELEKRRHERLLRQFAEYLVAARTGQRLPEVRKEAVVAGFAEAYRAARYADILAVGRKLPKRLVEEDPDIFDFIDIAEAKMES